MPGITNVVLGPAPDVETLRQTVKVAFDRLVNQLNTQTQTTPLDTNNNRVVNVATPVNGGDAVNLTTLQRFMQRQSAKGLQSALAFGGGGSGSGGGGLSLTGLGLYTVTASGGNVTIDFANGYQQRLVLTALAATVLAPIYTGGSISVGDEFRLWLDQPVAGDCPRPIFTLGAGAFASDVALAVSPAPYASTRTYIVFVFGGSVWEVQGVTRTGGAIT